MARLPRALSAALPLVLLLGPVDAQTVQDLVGVHRCKPQEKVPPGESGIVWKVFHKQRRELARKLRDQIDPFNDVRQRQPGALLARAREIAEKASPDSYSCFSVAAEKAMQDGVVHQVAVIDAELEDLGVKRAEDRWSMLEEAWTLRHVKSGWKVPAAAKDVKDFEVPKLAKYEFHMLRSRAAARAGRRSDAEYSLEQARKLAGKNKACRDVLLASVHDLWTELSKEGIAAPHGKRPAALSWQHQYVLLSMKGGKTGYWEDLRDKLGRDANIFYDARRVDDGSVDVRLTTADTERQARNKHLVCRISGWFLPSDSGKHVFRWHGLFKRPDRKWGPVLLNGAWLGDEPKGRPRRGEAWLMAGRPYRVDMYAKKNDDVDELTVRLFVDPPMGGRKTLKLWLDPGQVALLSNDQRKALRVTPLPASAPKDKGRKPDKR